MAVFENLNPTEAEKRLFQCAGFYKVKDRNDCLEYMPVCMKRDKEFPKRIEVSENQIGYRHRIAFDRGTETFVCTGRLDKELILLIYDRMVEMGWK